MTKELKDWFKAYLVVSLLVIPVLHWLLTPLHLILEGSLTTSDMLILFLYEQATSLVVVLVFMFLEICKTLYKKFRGKSCTA